MTCPLPWCLEAAEVVMRPPPLVLRPSSTLYSRGRGKLFRWDSGMTSVPTLLVFVTLEIVEETCWPHWQEILTGEGGSCLERTLLTWPRGLEIQEKVQKEKVGDNLRLNYESILYCIRILHRMTSDWTETPCRKYDTEAPCRGCPDSVKWETMEICPANSCY